MPRLGGPDTQVVLVENPRDADGNIVAGQFNTTDQRTLIVNNNALGGVVKTLVHDNYHQGGGSEIAASLIGHLGAAAFAVGNWTNSSVLAQYRPTPQYVFAGLNDSAAQQALLDSNRAMYQSMKAAGDDFDARQLNAREKTAIRNMATAYAVQLYQTPDAQLSPQQIAAAERVLLFEAEQMVDKATDHERANNSSAQDFITVQQ